MAEIIVVGSGAAGAAAALQLARRGLRPLVLDVGHVPEAGGPRIAENLYAYRRREDSFDLHIGDDLTGLQSVISGQAGIAKLNAPKMAFVTREAERLGPLDQAHFSAIQSFALGGLGNAWGAGLYRFIDADLRDFPLRAADLDPYFDALTGEIGISGQDDDLTPYFGDPAGLLPPLALSYNANRILQGYLRRRKRFAGRGVAIGYPRVAALSRPYDGRPAVGYDNLEFWQEQASLYTPAQTLRKLIAAGQIDYRPGLLVRSWRETTGGVAVRAMDLASGQDLEFAGQRLLLAAGAINTARLALQSFDDHETRLPLLENPVLQIPFVLPASIGRRLDSHAFGLVQLNLVWEAPAYDGLLQGSFVELTSPMRSEFFGRFPLSARANLRLIRQLLPAMLLMQLYYPAWIQQPAWLSLGQAGRLGIEGHAYRLEIAQIAGLLRMLRSIGLWTHALLIQQPPSGHAIHYAGTLPMRRRPARYQSDPAGRLAGTRHVYVADSAGFSSLPAKNMSFGMMANAMRIADAALRSLAPAQLREEPVKRVLITGAGGFIARHLAARLQQEGIEVIGTTRRVRPLPGFDRLYAAALGDSLADTLASLSPGALAAGPVDAIVHTALDPAGDAYEANLSGTLRWLEEGQAAGVSLQILLSSLSALPDAASDYGRAKYALEQAFLARGQVAFRLGMVVGAGGMFARTAAGATSSPVVPLLDGGRQFVYVLGIDFLCEVLRDCVVNGGQELRGRAWTLHQPQPVTLRELIQAIQRQAGRRAILLSVPARPVLAGLRLLERLPLPALPVSSANVQGLLRQGRQAIPTDFARFGRPEQSLEALIARASQKEHLASAQRESA